MKRQPALVRGVIPGVIPTNTYSGRAPRGVRRHNRRVIARARRGYKAPEVEEYPWALRVDIDRKALNSRGDCPVCRSPGGHPMETFRRNPDGKEVKLHVCSNFRCKSKFSPFAQQEGPPLLNGYDALPESKLAIYHDCPAAGCNVQDVATFVWMRDGEGRQVKACKCSNGHLFKPGQKATNPPSTLVQ